MDRRIVRFGYLHSASSSSTLRRHLLFDSFLPNPVQPLTSRLLKFDILHLDFNFSFSFNTPTYIHKTGDVDDEEDADAAAAEKEKAFDALVQKYHAPLSCCIQIWLTFAFTGQAILNCKIHKAYSLLRSELQSVLLKAFEKLQVDASDLSGGARLADSLADKSSAEAAAKRKTGNGKKQNGQNGQVGPASVPALKLAEILCSTFSGSQAAGLPVAVESEDDEDAAFNRILIVMGKSKTSLVAPLCGFIHTTLHLPLALHTAPTKILSELAEVANGAEIRTSFQKMASQKLDLTDVFAIMKKHLEESFPFTWVMFAMDVLELYTARGFFPEQTQEAGNGK